MLNEKLISQTFPTLLDTDTGNHALLLMEENNISQLPLVIDEKYVALITENELLDWATPEYPLSAAVFLTDYKPAVSGAGHPFDALKVASQFNLEIVPVIDRSNTYLGSITKNDLIKFITESSGLENPGGIIVLEMEARNYSLSQIARICENEDVIVISTQIGKNRDNGMLSLTIKTNKTDISALVNSFERYEYNVAEVFSESTDNETLMNRYSMLMNYINM